MEIKPRFSVFHSLPRTARPKGNDGGTRSLSLDGNNAEVLESREEESLRARIERAQLFAAHVRQPIVKQCRFHTFRERTSLLMSCTRSFAQTKVAPDVCTITTSFIPSTAVR